MRLATLSIKQADAWRFHAAQPIPPHFLLSLNSQPRRTEDSFIRPPVPQLGLEGGSRVAVARFQSTISESQAESAWRSFVVASTQSQGQEPGPVSHLRKSADVQWPDVPLLGISTGCVVCLGSRLAWEGIYNKIEFRLNE